MSDWKTALVFSEQEVYDGVQTVLTELKTSPDMFLHSQGERLEEYLNQLADGAITEQEFETYIADMRDLAKLQILKEKIQQKALVQKTIEILTQLALKGAVSAAKGFV